MLAFGYDCISDFYEFLFTDGTIQHERVDAGSTTCTADAGVARAGSTCVGDDVTSCCGTTTNSSSTRSSTTSVGSTIIS